MVLSRFFGSFMLALAIGISPVTIHARPQTNQTKQQSAEQGEQTKAQAADQKNKKLSIKDRILRALHLGTIRTENVMQISSFVILCCLAFAYTTYVDQKITPQYKPRNSRKPKKPLSDNHNTLKQNKSRNDHNANNVGSDNSHTQVAEKNGQAGQEHQAKEQIQDECHICLEEYSNNKQKVKLLPCNHKPTCRVCAQNLIICPFCYERIDSFEEIFTP